MALRARAAMSIDTSDLRRQFFSVFVNFLSCIYQRCQLFSLFIFSPLFIMFHTFHSSFRVSARRFLPLMLALCAATMLMLASCKDDKKDEPIDDPRFVNKSREELAEEVKRLSVTAAEKDSLFNEVVESTKFVSEVYTELSALSGELNSKNAENKPLDYKQEISKKIQLLSKRLQENEKRLRESQSRIQELKKKNSTFAAQIESYEKMIADLNSIVQSQKNEIVTLNEKVVELTGKVATLTEEKVQLDEKVTTLTEENNTGYFIVGTNAYLSENGIIERKGKVLFFGGKRVPTEKLNTGLFTAINITKQDEIKLPERLNEVVSSHDTSLLKTSEDGKTITITEPKKFWQTSRYLIIVIDG
jgi:DNA repair exonuclease SbcCD ATPase subunit